MDHDTFLADCRAGLARRIARARAAVPPDGLLGMTTLCGLADAAIAETLDRVGDAGLVALLAARPVLLACSLSEADADDLRAAVRAVLVDDARVRLDPELDAALAHGQRPDSLPRALAGARAALERAEAAGHPVLDRRDEILGWLEQGGEYGTPLYQALAETVASALRRAGEAAAAEILLAAHDGRALLPPDRRPAAASVA